MCDVTLSSGYYFVNKGIFIFDYNDGYFLTIPELFAINHFPETQQWTLLGKDSINFETFVSKPFVYSDTFKHRIAPRLPSTLTHTTKQDEAVNFKLHVEDNSTIDKLSIVSNNGWKVSEQQLQHYDYANGILSFKHQFSKKGLYDFHIYVDDSPVITYTIEVN